MKKFYYVTTFIIIMIVSFIGITYSYEYKDLSYVTFDLIGPEILYIDVYSTYSEYGVKASYNNVDVSDKVVIDSSSVDTSKLGEYLVKYSYSYGDNYEYIYRTVKVIDMTKPVINLVGGDDISILVGGTYLEYGYTVSDNYSKDLEDRVLVSGSVDTSKIGSYKIKYTVSDDSFNTSSVVRTVNVKKPVITILNENEYVDNYSKIDYTKYSNTVVKNSFNSDGIYLEGYSKNKGDFYKIKLKDRNSNNEYVYNMTVIRDNYYSGNMDLTMVSNGVYELYLVSDGTERLLNKLNSLSRLVRGKVGNKLVTFDYVNDNINIQIEDFKYDYDIVIDPGHGGDDIGSSNGIISEKDLNLIVSKYEKCRYEEMGYKVYMIRDNDSYGEMLGNNNLNKLERRALAIGYYGSTSKISYSNHHNGSLNTSDYGFEILVGNGLSKKDLVVEKSLYNKFKNYYKIYDNNIRLYSRDYEYNNILDKLDGNVYENRDYYAVIRIPNELYNVKNIIYEPIYLTNTSDFNWYYTNRNYIDVSEMKILEYVNFLGGKYISNTKCR